MTLEQLRIFVAVATREHVTQAARELNLTQSATSAAVAALEARYQTKLFDRVGRRIVLTAAGKAFLVEARAVLARAAAAETVLDDLASLKRGQLSLAASQTIAGYWLPAIIHRFNAAHPAIKLQLSIGNTEQVATAVREGAADLGFVEGDVDDPALAAQAVAEDEMVLVGPTDHLLCRGATVTAADLRSARWVLREQGSGTRAVFEAALGRFGITPAELDVVFDLPSNEAVRGAVEAGAGVTVLSRLVVMRAVKAGLLAVANLDLPKRHFYSLRHREHHQTQAAREFLRMAGEDRS
ncbi:LysR family transcriptional regulator [Bradyrhizobium sp. SSBR45G]|uniref:LysR family transcriptional regulator n=1 Tax=unclassified Bradyrhizobium TaxID=2631580 RepID=UPI002342A56D|nr:MULTISPECIES: LysR family transcriptional regulator [unclassified Bradyrhizobium]GLH76981.1 LysR family transcriptional regulator [Bradyrhizobium sp. SSBR45G]GLH83739.1 LysR family transcriptional regulator [Bradyrhizobium sp. SSBR45R]